MKEIVLLGDIHIGSRNDSKTFADYHISFFENQLFPFMKQAGITHIIQLGDIFDRRKFVNFSILSEWKNRIFNVMLETGVTMDVIAGNHDVFYKNTNDINSPLLLLAEYENIRVVYKSPEVFNYNGNDVLLVPWITSSNEKETFKEIKNTKATIAMGHFELNGFEMDKGHVHEGGLDAKKLSKFDTVYSGHFHHKSNNGHVYYIGTPYQITWSDFDSEKGFVVWNTETLESKFVKNNNEIFQKIYYDDSNDSENYYKTIKLDDLKNKLIKVIIVSKKNLYGFDQFMSALYNQTPAEIKIIESVDDYDSDIFEKEELNIENTVDIISNYVDSIDVSIDKSKLKTFMKTLYVEATNMETQC